MWIELKKNTEFKYALVCIFFSVLFLVWLIPAYTPSSTITGDMSSAALPNAMMLIILLCGAVLLTKCLLEAGAARKRAPVDSGRISTAADGRGADGRGAGGRGAGGRGAGGRGADGNGTDGSGADGSGAEGAAKVMQGADAGKRQHEIEDGRVPWRRLLMVLACVLAYLLALNGIGFYLTTLFALPLLVRFYNRSLSWGKILLSSAVLLVFIYVLFEMGLSVKMPRGIFF